MYSIQTPNNQLKERIDELEIHVQDRLGNRIRDLRILQTADGIVVRGYTSTYYAKQLAQHLIMHATTIPLLENEIEVK